MSKYTELEIKVLEAWVRIYNEYTDVINAHEIYNETTLSMKELRGVLSSLVKKRAIDIDAEYGNLISLFDDEYRRKMDRSW